MKNKKVYILYGGASSEREISLRSGQGMYNALQTAGYTDVTLFDAIPERINQLVAAKPDVCLLALHGKYGEDGAIQGYLEMQDIAYTGSGVSASAVAFDKYLSKLCFISAGIPTPPFCEKAPCVVKPAREGSTIGITIVKDDSGRDAAVEFAKKYDEKVVIEEYITGRELTVVIANGQALPIIQIKAIGGFYDYESKYTKGATEYLFDIGLSDEEDRMIKDIALKAYSVLGCEGVARVDVMYDENIPYVLEVNTVPGMTETSLVPKAANRAGIPFAGILEMMMEHGMQRLANAKARR